jgi:hypothetical protein
VTADDLAQLLSFSSRALEANLAGFNHAESLQAPPQGGNCVNWITGHILLHRNKMLALLGELPVWAEGDESRYERGSQPLADPAEAERLEVLREELERARERLSGALASVGAERLAGTVGTGTLQGRLMILLGHELYHAGQIAVLRRLSGRAGAIR